MPTVDNRILEALKRQQVVTEYIVYPQQNSNIENYQILLSNVPSTSKEDVLVVHKNKIIPHWVESKGKVWTKIPNLLTKTPLKIYTLTGNPSAASASNGTNTFVAWHGVATSNFHDSNIIPSGSIIYEAKGRSTIVSGNEVLMWGIGVDGNLEINSGTDGVALKSYEWSSVPGRYFLTTNGAAYTQVQGTGGKYGYNVWKQLKIVIDSTPSAHGYVDGVEQATGITTNLPNENLGLAMYTSAGTMAQEYSFVRKYASPEPIVKKIRTLNKSLLLKELMR